MILLFELKQRGAMLPNPSRIFAGLALAFMVGIAALPANAGKVDKQPRERIVMGWLESIVIEPWGVKLRAKLDTGAKTSAMHAKDIEWFKRKGRDWVRFSLSDYDKKTDETKVYTIERPTTREARVKDKKGNPVPRPVVSMEFCLDGVMYDAEFTLVDRSKYHYRVLLGRRFIKDVALVDPDATFITKSSRCTDGRKSRKKKKAHHNTKPDK
jgi:hypothetical protein